MTYYEIDGRIFNAYHKELGSKDKLGYIKFATCEGSSNKITQWLAHRWVWTKYNGPIPEGMDIDHIDFNPSNNRISNLQMVNRTQHRDRRTQKGTVKQRASGMWQALRNNKHLGMYGTKARAIMACALYKISLS